MAVNRVPPEVLSQILALTLENPTAAEAVWDPDLPQKGPLITCGLVCRYWLAVAQRLMYADIQLQRVQDLVLLHRTLTNSDILGKYVGQLSIHHMRTGTRSGVSFAQAQQMLAECLGQTSQLTTLSFHIHTSQYFTDLVAEQIHRMSLLKNLIFTQDLFAEYDGDDSGPDPEDDEPFPGLHDMGDDGELFEDVEEEDGGADEENSEDEHQEDNNEEEPDPELEEDDWEADGENSEDEDQEHENAEENQPEGSDAEGSDSDDEEPDAEGSDSQDEDSDSEGSDSQDEAGEEDFDPARLLALPNSLEQLALYDPSPRVMEVLPELFANLCQPGLCTDSQESGQFEEAVNVRPQPNGLRYLHLNLRRERPVQELQDFHVKLSFSLSSTITSFTLNSNLLENESFTKLLSSMPLLEDLDLAGVTLTTGDLFTGLKPLTKLNAFHFSSGPHRVDTLAICKRFFRSLSDFLRHSPYFHTLGVSFSWVRKPRIDFKSFKSILRGLVSATSLDGSQARSRLRRLNFSTFGELSIDKFEELCQVAPKLEDLDIWLLTDNMPRIVDSLRSLTGLVRLELNDFSLPGLGQQRLNLDRLLPPFDKEFWEEMATF